MNVDTKISYTVNLGNFNSAKIEVGIAEVDVNADIDVQLEQAVEVLRKTFVTMLDEAVVAAKKAQRAGVV